MTGPRRLELGEELSTPDLGRLDAGAELGHTRLARRRRRPLAR